MACRDVSWRALVGGELLLHRGVAEPLIADRDAVALLGAKAFALEELARVVARLDRQMRGATRRREFLHRAVEHRADALPGHRGMHVEQADLGWAIERDEADRRALHRGNERQVLGETG